ncbi:FAD-binding domain-containing protein [Phlegmacium glaucopus]|nr:FAD-binding domain-containing protein [Phlegmacium glaucopus]
MSTSHRSRGIPYNNMNDPHSQNVEKSRGASVEDEIQQICNQSKKSKLFRPGIEILFLRLDPTSNPTHDSLIGSEGYKRCMQHYLDSSSDDAGFAVEPGCVDDLVKIVKGGGHATNPGFSSTKGVHISMSLFHDISLSENKKILQIGAGCLFDDVYKYIQKEGRNIVGGYNHQKIGAAGWLLGGGYSLKTNRFGLGIDNIVRFHIVTPTGQNIDVTKDTKPDLFKGLKGGGNNFGIVTRFDLETHEQQEVYGGILKYKKEQVNDVKNVIESVIKKNADEKFAMTAAFIYGDPDKFEFAIKYFFDGEKQSQPDDINDFEKRFTNIKHMGELKQTTFFDMDKPSGEAGNSGPIRGRWGTVMVSKFTSAFIDAVSKEAENAANSLKQDGKKDWTITIKIKFYRDDIFSKSKSGNFSAWPHKRCTSYAPILVSFQWNEKDDDFYVDKMKTVLSNIRAKAIECKCTTADAPVYSNMALVDFTKAEDIYGEGLKELGRIRKCYDPSDVMGRVGGFRIPLDASGS